MQRLSFILFIILPFKVILAQPFFKRADTIPVTIAGVKLKNPWAGGFNSAQFSGIDVNGDGKKDLFVFNRSGAGPGKDKILIFLNQGTANSVDYKYAPEYAARFPDLHDWALLVDYNCDGKEDIFTYSSQGAGSAVFRNDYNSTDGLKFTLVSPQLKSVYGSVTTNIYISPVDLPAFIDVDNDGDLDVLNFGIGCSENSIEYHQNQSKELGYGCDSLIFKHKTYCWGSFVENPSNNNVQLGIQCPCKNGLPPDLTGKTTQTNLHAGSVILAFDVNGDGLKDVALGDISANNMVLLINGGRPGKDSMVVQDPTFPSNTVSVNVTVFPAGYYVDVNNDNAKDLIVSPNSPNGSENFNSAWYYKNTGTSASPVFAYQKKNFLQEEMVETGAGNYPVFFDYDGDGLQDLVIGNFGYFSFAGQPYKSGLSLYKNVGTPSAPSFDLITRDYLGLYSYNLNNIFPAFGDLDADGDMDLVIGEEEGTLLYFRNTAAPGATASFTLANIWLDSIDVGQSSAPQIADVNRDNLPDLVIGEMNGNLNYYQNTGTATAPKFTLVANKWGNVDVREAGYTSGYSVPFLFDDQGSYKLIVGTERGHLFLYENIDGNLSGPFTKKDTMYLGIWEGIRSSLSGKDINNDQKTDLVIGNFNGGVSIFLQDTSSSVPEPAEHSRFDFTIFPNPASHYLVVELNRKTGDRVNISITNLLGQEIISTVSGFQTRMDISQLSPGVYFCSVTARGEKRTKKILVKQGIF